MTLFPNFPDHAPLTAEEALIWQAARSWRKPESVAAGPDMNWDRWLEIVRANNMGALLSTIVANAPRLRRDVPEAALSMLTNLRREGEANAELMAKALQDYLQRTADRDVETVVLKGLWVSEHIYGDAAIRPGGDIDVLHRRRDIPASLEVLGEMGLGRYWPNLLDDAYYDRHHLHQQRSSRDLKIWFEPHWAFDHPYTLFTVDYEGIMDRTRPARLLNAPIRDLSPPDLLLSLCLHLVKHAVYLPEMVDRPDLPRLILADGMLMYYLDVAELLSLKADDMDWSQVVQLALDWGTGEVLRSVLTVSRRLFDSPVPEPALAQLPESSRGPLVRAALDRMVAYELATYGGESPDRLWHFLTIPNGAFILRPIRALDAIAYLVPPRDFLNRRYGAGTAGVAARHLISALGQFIRLSVDTGRFAWERYRRLKALKQSASLFNRLEHE